MKYVRIPTELPISDVVANSACLSPGRYARFIPPEVTKHSWFAPLDKLVILRESRATVKRGDSYKYAEIGDIDVGTGGVTFRDLRGFQLPDKRPAVARRGDVLVSTVRTYQKGIGYISVDGGNLVTTNAFLNICAVSDFVPDLTLLYVYSFLRSDFFSEQVWSLLHRGMYPRLDKRALDKILIPMPSDSRAFKYVSALVQAIIDKETAIRNRHMSIMGLIGEELSTGFIGGEFKYSYPTTSDIRASSRLDAGLYCDTFQSLKHWIDNYRYGSTTLSRLGVKSRRGPNLAVSVIGKSLYSNQNKPGWYQLIRPLNITDFGTLMRHEYLGSLKKLPLVKAGEIVFGCEATWRSLVLCEAYDRCTTNFHGTVLYWPGKPIGQVIWIRCILEYLRSKGMFRYVAVGGQGGHLSPEYFDYIPIPKFPEDKQNEISALYHEPASPQGSPTVEAFVEWHRRRNAGLGIWELDKEIKELQQQLAGLQEQIIQGGPVSIPSESN